jgi:AcrR family transcriptional regulator
VLTDMDGMAGQPYFPRSTAMFSQGTTARAELATNLAIPIVAEGGWGALTQRNLANAANVTPQAIAAWFPSVGAMRAAVAGRYGDRWIRERGYLARTRARATSSAPDTPTVEDVVVALLPQAWHEEVFDGIWLTIVEAGRWDEAVGSAVAATHEREWDLVSDLLDPLRRRTVEDLEPDVDLVLTLVRGLRAIHVPRRDGLAGTGAARILARLGAAT